jgi:hypothetical protein
MRIPALLAFLLVLPRVAQAQADTNAIPSTGGLYWGPRFGLTYLSPAVVDHAKDKNNLDLAPVVIQVGWSWEQRFVISPQSPMPMTQFVLLVGGAEQGVFLPSLTWLIGVRGLGGGEAGFGPNVSLTGMSMAFAFGVAKRVGALNIPFDVGVVVGKPGLRVSFLTGFNMQRAPETSTRASAAPFAGAKPTRRTAAR